MKKVLVPVADGSEEMEAVIIVDVLRRAEIEVVLASVMHERTIVASRKIQLQTDLMLRECDQHHWDMIVLPGGMPGAERLSETPLLIEMVKNQLHHERWLGAICAAPAVVLGRHHLIGNFTATCHPNFQGELQDQAAIVSTELVALDRNLITSQGPGTAFLFALKLVELLQGKLKAAELAEAMVVT